MTATDTRLYEFDKEEWWDVMRLAVKKCGGTMTRDEYEEHWEEFCAMKARRAMN